MLLLFSILNLVNCFGEWFFLEALGSRHANMLLQKTVMNIGTDTILSMLRDFDEAISLEVGSNR